MNSRPLVSLAIPAYNEEENIPVLFDRIRRVIETVNDRYEFEIVICENGSEDETFETLLEQQALMERVKVVRLSRNFHMEGGMMAALAHVSGDVTIVMSADLQDPPELIPEMLALWSNGFDHVYTVIEYRHGESWFRRTMAEAFYWLISKVSDTPVPRNSSDFRLVDRKMVEAFNSLPESFRMVRATWGWLGFKSTEIRFERPARSAGRSSFNPFVTGAYAIRGIIASSLTPLKVIPVFGILLSLLSFIALAVFAFRAVLVGVPFAGFGTLLSAIFLMFGLLFLMLSVIAEYVGLIYIESRGRPSFVLRDLHLRDAEKNEK